MPELPEVETYVRELAPLLGGRQVTQVQLLWPGAIAAPAANTFAAQLVGQRFAQFSRRGKYMLLGLANSWTLVVHLRMTGRLLVQSGPPPTHTHVILQLENGQQLFYQDARKFGRLWLMADPAPVLAKLGPEPFDARFTPQLLATTLAGRQASIKALLLDQRLVAGVGNIYADEALFRAAIHPARAGGTLLPAEVDLLHRAILQVLNEGIASAGSSLGTSGLQNYSRPGGAPGGFQEQFNVFRRTGAPCRHCNTPIQRRVLAQRSTHFCPRCQR